MADYITRDRSQTTITGLGEVRGRYNLSYRACGHILYISTRVDKRVVEVKGRGKYQSSQLEHSCMAYLYTLRYTQLKYSMYKLAPFLCHTYCQYYVYIIFSY